MRLFGIIGNPLTHSQSHLFFQKKFETKNIQDAQFKLFPLEKIEFLPPLIDKYPELKGFCVTIPFKEQIIPYLDRIEATASQIGAVNCVVIARSSCPKHDKNWHLTGYNTDLPAFKVSLINSCPVLPKHALILGTGGVAKTVKYALDSLHIDSLYVSRRKKEYSLTYEQLSEELIAKHGLIINCTPIGMFPNEDRLPPLPYHALTPQHLLMDLIYNPSKTLFLQEGEKHDCRIKNGTEMLYEQAELNWKIWNHYSEYSFTPQNHQKISYS